jgi:hypothetical protein
VTPLAQIRARYGRLAIRGAPDFFRDTEFCADGGLGPMQFQSHSHYAVSRELSLKSMAGGEL